MQLYHRVFSLHETDALIFSGTSADSEGDHGDVTGGGVSRQNSETAQWRARFDRRHRRSLISDVDRVSHVVAAVHVPAADVPPETARRPRRKHALRLRPSEHVCVHKSRPKARNNAKWD